MSVATPGGAPDWLNAVLLAGFTRKLSPLSLGVCASVWRQCSICGIRPDFALFHILYITKNLHSFGASVHDFGGGPALTQEQGVIAAVFRLSLLKNEWHLLPYGEYQGVLKLEHDFLVHVGMIKEDRPMGFVAKLSFTLILLNFVLWLVGLFVPGPFVLVLQGIVKYGADALLLYPHWWTAVLISLFTFTHAVALKTEPPKWIRPDKSKV